MNCRIAADIGGTFTDIVCQDVATGACTAGKVLSTPENPALAVLRGIQSAVAKDAPVEFFVHGTTVGLNALLTRTGAKVALVANRNFRDIYTIQGNNRGEIFSIRWNKPDPLVPLEDTFTVRGRIAGTGEVAEELRLEDLDRLAAEAREKRYEAVAVCLLFSFKNPEHELAVERHLSARLPGVEIALSHRVSPEWREFERTSTTVMDSYLAPVVRGYLDLLVGELKERFPRGRGLYVMKSNGGVMSAAAASRSPLQTLFSGPVGGAIGGRALSADAGRPNLICIDMGGTSFDASLVVDGSPTSSNEAIVEGLPVQMSVVDINVIGAGGGSIVWEESGALRVGPQSAGSVPGPICYGRGGAEPTVSDANLVLGRLDSSNFPESELTLDAGAARSAMERLGSGFGMDAQAMAQGVVDIINAKMADAIRTITVRRGIDPRDFSLVAFGGAGPAQAAALAAELEIREVIVPVHPGAFSAWGMLQTDIRHDLKETLFGFWDALEPSEIETRFARLEGEGRDQLAGEGVAESAIAFERAADFRYLGQEYVLTVPVPGGSLDMAAIRRGFDDAYMRQYGHNSPDARVELANLRVTAVGRLPRPARADMAVGDAAAPRSREVYFDGAPRETAILDRAGLAADDVVAGPAVIEEATATTLVPPGWMVRLMDGGHLLMTFGEGE